MKGNVAFRNVLDGKSSLSVEAYIEEGRAGFPHTMNNPAVNTHKCTGISPYFE